MSEYITKKIIVEFKEPLKRGSIKVIKEHIKKLNRAFYLKSVYEFKEINTEKHWRYSDCRYYYEDDKYGYAYIDKYDDRISPYYAFCPEKMMSDSFKILREAKAWVESLYKRKKK